MFGGHLNLTVMKNEQATNTVTLHTAFIPTALDAANLQPNQVSSYNWLTFCTDPTAWRVLHRVSDIVNG